MTQQCPKCDAWLWSWLRVPHTCPPEWEVREVTETDDEYRAAYKDWIAELEELAVLIAGVPEFPEPPPQDEVQPDWVEELVNGELPEKSGD